VLRGLAAKLLCGVHPRALCPQEPPSQKAMLSRLFCIAPILKPSTELGGSRQSAWFCRWASASTSRGPSRHFIKRRKQASMLVEPKLSLILPRRRDGVCSIASAHLWRRLRIGRHCWLCRSCLVCPYCLASCSRSPWLRHSAESRYVTRLSVVARSDIFRAPLKKGAVAAKQRAALVASLQASQVQFDMALPVDLSVLSLYRLTSQQKYPFGQRSETLPFSQLHLNGPVRTSADDVGPTDKDDHSSMPPVDSGIRPKPSPNEP
jgi:hypothetical protein